MWGGGGELGRWCERAAPRTFACQCDAASSKNVYTWLGSYVYTGGMDWSPDVEVVWDERNLFHLLVERAHRGISVDDVEHVLTDPGTRVRRLPTGADLYIGRAASGRPLAVVTVGVAEL